MKRLAILGAGSWLGGFLRASALELGWSVHVIGRRPGPGVDAVVRGADDLRSALDAARVNATINCVGVRSGSIESMVEANIEWVRTALRVVTDLQIRFVHLGTAAEYGDPGDTPVREEHRRAPMTDYGVTKAVASSLVEHSEADAVVARVFNVAGPAPRDGSLLADLLGKIEAASGAKAGEIELANAGLRRDWLTAPDMSRALLALAQMRDGERVINVCSGVGVTHGELALALARRRGTDIEVRSLDQAGIASVIGDPTRLRVISGLSPRPTADDLAHAVLAMV